MPGMGINFRIAKKLSDPAINEFYNNFHKAGRTEEEFNWEFSTTPAGKAIYVQAVEEDGKIAGSIAAIPLVMIGPGGEKFLTGKPEDTMVEIFASLRYRKTDILTEMYTRLEDACRAAGMEIFWGFTYETKPFERLGFETGFHALQGLSVISPFPTYRNISGLNSHNRAKDKFMIALLVAGSYILGIRRSLRGSKLPGRLVYDDLSGHEELLKSHLEAGDKMYCLVQDAEYLEWRIKNNPNKISYKTVSLVNSENRKEIEIIVSINRDSAFIEQMIFRKNVKKAVVLRMIKQVVSMLKKEQVSVVRFMGFNTNPINRRELALLKSSGFVISDRGIPFVFKKIGTRKLDIRPENIFLSRLFTQGNT